MWRTCGCISFGKGLFHAPTPQSDMTCVLVLRLVIVPHSCFPSCPTALVVILRLALWRERPALSQCLVSDSLLVNLFTSIVNLSAFVRFPLLLISSFCQILLLPAFVKQLCHATLHCQGQTCALYGLQIIWPRSFGMFCDGRWVMLQQRCSQPWP